MSNTILGKKEYDIDDSTPEAVVKYIEDNAIVVQSDYVSLPNNRNTTGFCAAGLLSAAFEISDDTNTIIFSGVNGLELLALVYANNTNPLFKKHRSMFLEWANPKPNYFSQDMPSFRYKKTLDGAVAPTKNRFSDSGFDLTLIRLINQVGRTFYYDTGIQVQPDNGYYFELYGRSSISKTGYILANAVGILDASYRGNVIVALIKIDPNADDLILPKKLVQIIPKRLHLLSAVESSIDLEETIRGNNGFGSSDNINRTS